MNVNNRTMRGLSFDSLNGTKKYNATSDDGEKIRLMTGEKSRWHDLPTEKWWQFMKSVINLEMMTSHAHYHPTCCIAILRHQLATSTINQSAAFHSCLYVLKTTCKTKAPQTHLFSLSPSFPHPFIQNGPTSSSISSTAFASPSS